MAFVIVSALIFLFATHAHAASLQPAALKPPQISAAIDSFSMKLLAKTSDISKGDFNLALSPYTIWTLLAIIHEGAKSDTATELEQVLGIPSCEQQACQDNFREEYKKLVTFLSKRPRDVDLSLANGIFIDESLSLNPAFEEVAQNVYGVNVVPTDYTNKQKAAKHINQYIFEKTRQTINEFINAGDLKDTVLFLTSALYFRGLWQTPFNKSATKKETFFDQHRKPLTEVDMMYLKTPLPFTTLFDKKANAVELKYGNGDRISMIVIVPKWSSSLSEVLELLTETPIGHILDDLTESEKKFVEENVVVHLPRFKIMSDFAMNGVLDDMGVKSLFSMSEANLTGISPARETYVSRVLQRAVIEVDEDGTVAAAAGGASISNKSPPGELKANRPFAYIIVDKPTQTVLFAGTVQNPNVISQR